MTTCRLAKASWYRRNRWARLAQAIDWDAEQEYSGHFGAGGKVVIPACMAFGVLVIRAAVPHNGQRNGGDRARKPYLQYFWALILYL